MSVYPNSNNRTKNSKGENATRVVAEVTLLPEIDSNIDFDVADGNVSAIKAIYKTINGVAHGDPSTYAEATIIGVSITGNTNGNVIKYKIAGKLEDSSFSFPVNDPIYLGSDGAITNTPPTIGHSTRLGSSLGVGAIQIEIEEPIIL